MRSLFTILLVLQFLTSHNCAKKNEVGGQSWLNIEYVECLKNKLPCECEKDIGAYYSLVLDTDPNSKNFGIALSKFEEMEPNMYPIKKITSNEFEVQMSRKDTSIWATVVVKDRELQFIDGGIISKFSKSIKSHGYNVAHYKTDNVQLLNEAFIARGYPKLEEIVKEDVLSCDCNKWMGRQNVLYVKGAPKSWIIELKNDSLQILKITNVDRDPDDDVKTEKVISYKWK